MNAKIATVLLVTLMTATTLSAQNNGNRRERQNKMDMTEIYNRQASRLAKQMKLNDEKEGVFTVLYLDYRNARHNAVNPQGGDQENAEQRADFTKMSDEEATALIQKYMDRQERQLAVDKEYLPKFLEILTPAQTAQVYMSGGAGMRPGMMGGPMGGGRGGFGGGRPGGFGGPGGGF